MYSIRYWFLLVLCMSSVYGKALPNCKSFCACIEAGKDLALCDGFFDGGKCTECDHDIGKDGTGRRPPPGTIGDPLSDDDFDRAAQFLSEGKFVGSRAAAHYETASDYFEGDMIGLSVEKMREIEKDRQLIREYSESQNRETENELAQMDQADVPREVQFAAQRDARYKWPYGIVPYEISSYYNSDQRAVIAMAMKHIESRTCIRFTPYNSNVHDNYISIWPAGAGTCAAAVGRQFYNGGGQQAVMLGAWCLWGMGTAIHELMHALGFFHEQSRADRDEYVTILWNNIPSNTQYNFQKYDLSKIQHLGVPYDYASVMHYSSTAFGINGAVTIQPKQWGAVIGQRDGMSEYDAMKINRLYECQGVPSFSPVTELPPTTTTKKPSCVDTYEYCDSEGGQYWCYNQLGSFWNIWMLKQCQLTCGQCK